MHNSPLGLIAIDGYISYFYSLFGLKTGYKPLLLGFISAYKTILAINLLIAGKKYYSKSAL